MADYTNKTERNIAGRYYVDTGCICCGICTVSAPSVFMISLSGEYGYVGRQPRGKAEEAAVREAVESCPVGAIGDDGDGV